MTAQSILSLIETVEPDMNPTNELRILIKQHESGQKIFIHQQKWTNQRYDTIEEWRDVPMIEEIQ